MRARNLYGASLAFSALVAGALPALAAGDPTGVWMNDSGEGAIEIKPCGKKMCGTLVWIKNAADVKRGCNKQIIGDVAKVGSSTWDNGWIYSPEKKRKYDVELKPLPNGKLKVTGYMGSKLFSQSFVWKKAPDDLMRCDGSGTILAAATPKPDAKDASDKPASKKSETKSDSKVAAKIDAPVDAPAAKITDANSGTRAADAQKAPLPGGTAPSALGGPDLAEEPATSRAIVPPKPVPAVRPEKDESAPQQDVAEVEPNLLPVDPPRGDIAADGSDEGTDSERSKGKRQNRDEADDAEVETPRLSRLAARLREIERETGYGLKETSRGKCLLKVPYATIEIPCKK